MNNFKKKPIQYISSVYIYVREVIKQSGKSWLSVVIVGVLSFWAGNISKTYNFYTSLPQVVTAIEDDHAQLKKVIEKQNQILDRLEQSDLDRTAEIKEIKTDIQETKSMLEKLTIKLIK